MNPINFKSLLPLSGALFIGCGAETITEEEARAAANCTEDNTLCVNLKVPADYAGVPSRLATAFYDSTETNRPPDATMPEIDGPTIIAGEEYDVSHTQMEVDGEYFLMFVLYDEEGGNWVPEAGIDYTAMTDEPVVFDGNPVNLGELVLEPAS